MYTFTVNETCHRAEESERARKSENFGRKETEDNLAAI
jgi:hypothetical protein